VEVLERGQVPPHDDQVHPPLMELLELGQRPPVPSHDRERELHLLAGGSDRRPPVEPHATLAHRETESLAAIRRSVVSMAEGRIDPMFRMGAVPARIHAIVSARFSEPQSSSRGWRSMPHFGHCPGSDNSTSGCIGHL
jgi:hypothetical protein